MGVERGEPARIRFTSFLSENALEFYRQVVDWLGETTGLPVAWVEAAGGLRTMMAAGKVEVAFTCGLPYVLARENLEARAPSLLAAPVLAGDRYGGRPTYFSDFIVRTDADISSFEALRGGTFAYNEPESLSGYVLPRHWLLARGETAGFFDRWVRSGSHAASMDWVESGRADCAAIDSFVLEVELRRRPERAKRLQVVASAGPLAMPPVVASGELPEDTAGRLRQALSAMHSTARGQSVLAQGGVRCFAPVTDEDYDAIHHVWQVVQGGRRGRAGLIRFERR